MDTKKILPIYHRFVGMLSQTPSVKDVPVIYDQQVWNFYHSSIAKLGEATGKDYTEFEIVTSPNAGIGEHVSNDSFRRKLGALIDQLRAEYFPEEDHPYSPKPATLFTQTNNQSIEVDIAVRITNDMQSIINGKIDNFKEGTPERNFLDSLKSKVTSLKDISLALSQIMTLAVQHGLTAENLKNIFN